VDSGQEQDSVRAIAAGPLRTLAEHLTHRFVIRRRLPRPFPRLPLYVSTEGGLKYLKPSLHAIDRPLLDCTLAYVQPGSEVWDIGANLGLFSLAAAAICGPNGHVLAIEPDGWLSDLLARTTAAPGTRAAIDVVCAAAWREHALLPFNIAVRSRSTNYLSGFGSTQTGGSRSCRLTPAYPLDAFLEKFPPPDLIKVDVEGAEIEVLRGAKRCLKPRPILLLEVSSENMQLVSSILKPLGYRFMDGETKGHPTVSAPTYLTIAVPVEG
jgi:FkbM family methyltransferase